MRFFICLNGFFYFILFASCNKFLEVNPPIDQIIPDDIFSSNRSAASVLTGIYIDMASPGIFAGINSIGIGASVSSDEMVSIAPSSEIQSRLYTNSLTNNGDQLFWTPLYSYIYRINSAINGLEKSKGLTSDAKNQLLGEARFLRALMYFNLYNLYGSVPLLLDTDPKINSQKGRTEKDKIFAQMVDDLKISIESMKYEYLSSDLIATSKRFRPNKSVAMALLARVYLYNSDWQNAESVSSVLIQDVSRFKLEQLSNVFLNSSQEAIWQLQSVSSQYPNTLDGRIFILSGNVSNGLPEGPSNSYGRPVYLQNELVKSFPANDLRLVSWVDSVLVSGQSYYYPIKYKSFLENDPPIESLTMFRLSEQYLIRAEARAHMGKLVGDESASTDVSVIRKRSGLTGISITNQEAILPIIMEERRHEFFCEFAHRWFDLKRTGTINAVMEKFAPKKSATWEPYKSLLPIPVSEFTTSPVLKGHQNPGYPEF